mmetsp:Transcript_24896/g.25117  ORF Transcript_24896/g.25117 Transcript_24896/m.25117 type:complete len:208 (-) Transcript_24896:294-917(-)|eukprot:CAMPEP_0182418984 /NCGR_PEP_ID=MMETSP1167-20130531/3363_1 /TAXON_ID=2988 /ORGANISM="Mallomonas Sp, Strain CCMP3275" /LENGTH=207 /DNA_ID=CAMNT_0024593507 /DNA_START=189 /DNA_END=812 /DNA_ORIENTATION=+
MADADEEPYDIHIKLLMLGDQGVGKTCILLRYCHDSFSSTFITTIGIDFKIKTVDVDGMRTRLQIWDTAGQERFRNITISYFKGAHGVVLVYDITERATFDSISHWMEQIQEHADDAVNVILIANKSDRETDRKVTREEGVALARKYDIPFLEVSAKNNVNISHLFETIARSTKNRLIQPEEQKGKIKENKNVKLNNAEGKKKSGCC